MVIAEVRHVWKKDINGKASLYKEVLVNGKWYELNCEGRII
ncbi:hypothetical protein JOC34_000482 [Virgibacillus halotolerans]|nr:hypothetical protein [Virgibacillus halotolerans]